MRVYGELARGARPRRDRDRRRRRLRLLRRPRGRLLRAGLLARPRARSAASAAGPGYALAAKLAHPDRQVVLLLGDGAFGFSRDGVRHARAPRRARRRRDGQQRHLGAREAPDGVPLRLLGRRRAAARRRATTRSSRRSAATASSCARPDELRGALERAFAAGEPALVNVLTDPSVAYPRTVEPGLSRRGRPKEKPPAAGAGGFQSGPVRTGRGTCLEGPIEWSGRREAPMMRHRPDLCVERTAAGGTTALSDTREYLAPRAVDGAIEQTSMTDVLDLDFSGASARVASATPQQDVVLGDLDALEAERTRAPRAGSTTPATIVGARSGCRPRTSRRSASGSAASRASSSSQRGAASARGPGPARGRRARAPRSIAAQRGRRAGDARSRRRRARADGAGTARLETSRARRRASACELVAARRVVRAGGARCGARRRPASRRGSRPAPRAPTTSSVEPPPMSMTSSGVASSRSRSRSRRGTSAAPPRRR